MIVGLLPTYQEGTLARGALRCLLECCRWVQVCEGPIAGAEFEGPATELGELRHEKGVLYWQGSWQSEHEKRNAMLAKFHVGGERGWLGWGSQRWAPPVWGIYLDADELLLGARWVPDLIEAAVANVAAGEEPASIPIPITEVDGSIGRVHRILRLDLLVRHVLSMSQFEFRGSAAVVTLPLLPVWRPGEAETAFARRPLEGEPHIHHRAYYRPARSERQRLHAREVEDFRRLEVETGIPAGGGAPIAKEGDGGFAPLETTPEEEEIIRRLASPFRPNR